jgi:hypothetical protein
MTNAASNTAAATHWSRAAGRLAQAASFDAVGDRDLGEMAAFDYCTEARLFPAGGEADLFATGSWSAGRQPDGYARFARAADAIRFAIEELPAELLRDTFLKVDDVRFDGDAIRRLYDNAEYPLVRRAAGR